MVLLKNGMVHVEHDESVYYLFENEEDAARWIENGEKALVKHRSVGMGYLVRDGEVFVLQILGDGKNEKRTEMLTKLEKTEDGTYREVGDPFPAEGFFATTSEEEIAAARAHEEADKERADKERAIHSAERAAAIERAHAHFMRDYREIEIEVRNKGNFWTRLMYERYIRKMLMQDYIDIHLADAEGFTRRDKLFNALFGEQPGPVRTDDETMRSFFDNISLLVEETDPEFPAGMVQFEAMAALLKRNVNNILDADVFSMHTANDVKGNKKSTFDLKGDALLKFAERNECVVVPVSLEGFGEEGDEVQTREVLIDRSEWDDATIDQKLEKVFVYGQNDFQPNGRQRSVGMGDVLRPALWDEREREYDGQFGPAPEFVVDSTEITERRIYEVDRLLTMRDNFYAGYAEKSAEEFFDPKHLFGGESFTNSFLTLERVVSYFPDNDVSDIEDPYFIKRNIDTIIKMAYGDARGELNNIAKKQASPSLLQYANTRKRGGGDIQMMPVKVKNEEAYLELCKMIEWDDYIDPASKNGSYLSTDAIMREMVNKVIIAKSNTANNAHIYKMLDLYFETIGMTRPADEKKSMEILDRIVKSGATVEGTEPHYLIMNDSTGEFYVTKLANSSLDDINDALNRIDADKKLVSDAEFRPAERPANDILVTREAGPDIESEPAAVEEETGRGVPEVDQESVKEIESVFAEEGAEGRALSERLKAEDGVAEVHLDESQPLEIAVDGKRVESPADENDNAMNAAKEGYEDDELEVGFEDPEFAVI